MRAIIKPKVKEAGYICSVWGGGYKLLSVTSFLLKKTFCSLNTFRPLKSFYIMHAPYCYFMRLINVIR